MCSKTIKSDHLINNNVPQSMVGSKYIALADYADIFPLLRS